VRAVNKVNDNSNRPARSFMWLDMSASSTFDADAGVKGYAADVTPC
jgi:hypothetical protein